MKSSLVAAGLVFVVPTSYALINFTSSQLDLTNTVGITYDSNVTGSSGFAGPATGKEDTYVNYSPRLDYTRKAGLIQLESNAGVNFLRYFDQTNLNSEDFSANLKLSLAEAIRGAYNGNLSLSYVEGATVETDVNTRVQSNTLTFSANVDAKLSRRMSLSTSASYSNSERSSGSDSESVGANAMWSLQDFLRGTALRIGYTYSYTHSEASIFAPISLDQTSNEITAGLSRPLFPHGETTIFADAGYRWLDRSEAEQRAGLEGDGGVVFKVGINGPFLSRERFPKLTSSLAISYSQAPSPGLNDDDERSLQGSVALDWQARPSTTLGVTLAQTRSLTISNLTANSSTFDFRVNQNLRYNLTGTASVGYARSTYDAPRVTAPAGSTAAEFYASSFVGRSRKDDSLSFTSGLTYAFARVWSANARYEYRAVYSSLDFGDYDHHLVNLNVSCRY